MFWQEETSEEQFVVPGEVVDLLYKIDCPTLPLDHAWSLSEAIFDRLPWFADEQFAGLHLIYGADSGNGWERPSDNNDLLYLSRRTRMSLRLPAHRLADAEALCGATLEIQGNKLKVGEARSKPLAVTTTLYSRQVICEPTMDEDQFIELSVNELRAQNVRFKKILCGKSSRFASPQGELEARSLMVAGLTLEDSITLQQHGIGPHRTRGFGLFIPHKTV